MEERIIRELEQEEQTPFHKKLLDHCKSLVNMSRRHMQEFYSDWDHNSEVYRGERKKDRSDSDAEERGEPQKMVVPVTHAQVEALIAFCTTLYMQRQHVFELIATGEEDVEAAKIAQAVLDRDLAYNRFEMVLRQWLLNICRFGIGVLKIGWLRKTQKQLVNVEQPAPKIFGIPLGSPSVVQQEQDVVTYEGNKIINVSPYRFFPDTRMPLARLQEGEFVATEEWYNLPNLRAMAARGEAVGIDWVKPLQSTMMEERQNSRRNSTLQQDDAGTAMLTTAGGQGSKMYVLTEIQVNIVPKDFLIDGEPLGDETTPVKYNIWYVNDQRIVRLEELPFNHDEYTYAVGQYAADDEELIGLSLCDSIDMLQQVLSWFINSHIESVRKVIGDRLVVDPSLIKWEDIEERSPVIRLKQDAGGMDVDKAVKQLSTVDVTGKHMDDADRISQWIKLTTGIQDNALGQYFTGRRTATEANSVNSATAARLKTFALINFRSGLEPVAKQMVSNCRQFMDTPQLIRVAGEMSNMAGVAQFMSVDKSKLVGNYDFEVFDGTVPSERASQALAIQEFLLACLSNPQAVVVLGYDPVKIVTEWLTLRDIRHPERLKMDQIRMMELAGQMAAVGLIQPPGATSANEPTDVEGGDNGRPTAPTGGPSLPVVPPRT